MPPNRRWLRKRRGHENDGARRANVEDEDDGEAIGTNSAVLVADRHLADVADRPEPAAAESDARERRFVGVGVDVVRRAATGGGGGAGLLGLELGDELVLELARADAAREGLHAERRARPSRPPSAPRGEVAAALEDAEQDAVEPARAPTNASEGRRGID